MHEDVLYELLVFGMTQEEIVEFLQKNHKYYYSTKELSAHLGRNTISINRCMRKLFQYGYVKRRIKGYKPISRIPFYQYRYKH